MATTATPWSGEQGHKLYLQSGQFTSTIKDSEDVSSLAPSLTIGICWDGTNTPWSSDYANKLYLQSGQFTSTLKTSQNINSTDSSVINISADDNNTPWCGVQYDKLYLTSGQFSSIIKDSEYIGGLETQVRDISYDGVNTPWTGFISDKLYLQSGQFTSTIKTSQSIGAIDSVPTGISWDGTNTPWSGADADKLYLQSGQFTSTLKTSEYVGGVDNVVVGISTDDYESRVTDLDHSLDHTLNLVQTLGVLVDYECSVSNTMNLSQLARPGLTFFESASSEMNLVSVLSRCKEANASSTMNLTQQILKFHIPNDFIPVETVINFSQQAEWEVGNYQHIVQNLNLVQQVDWQGPHYFYINTYLTFLDQEVNAYHGCPWSPVEFEDDLNLVSVVNRTQDLDANSVIAFAYEMYRSQTPESTLNLSQVVEAGKSKSITPSELNLNQTVNLTGLFQRTLEYTNIIGHALTYYVDSSCGDKEYIPLVGETTISGAPTPPSIDKPIVQHDPTTTRFKLVYPGLATPTDEVELRAPELDNIDRLAFSRISRETRGGKLTVFADPNWPQVQTVIVTFIGLLKAEVNSLLDFLIAHVGEEIGMQDWEGREWVGIITTPNESAVQDGKQRWTITFEFEGVLVDSHTPSDQLELVDTLDLEVDYARGLTHDLGLIHFVTFILV